MKSAEESKREFATAARWQTQSYMGRGLAEQAYWMRREVFIDWICLTRNRTGLKLFAGESRWPLRQKRRDPFAIVGREAKAAHFVALEVEFLVEGA